MINFFQILHENILEDKGSFYTFASHELHNMDHITVYSDEPLGSNYSCFDYNHEGDDREENDSESDRRFVWKDCKLNFDDDGLYWKSKSGKNACLLVYAIAKAEARPNYIKVWVTPKDSSDEMGVVEFCSKN
jgi:hypothetical protein